MGASVRQLAGRFIGLVKSNPAQAPDICRQAAYTFMGLAQDPKNHHAAAQLAKIGLEFAGAAASPRPVVMDDFQDLLQETAVAYEQAGDDPMDLIARRREIHDARTPGADTQILITPPSFNRDATLGRSAVIKFAPTSDEIAQGILQSQNVAFWQGLKKEAQAMTVDVSLGFLPPIPITFGEPGALTSVRPFAEVEFGSDGNRTKIKFDLAFGKRLTVPGNYIAVTVGCDPPMRDTLGALLPTTSITAGASIGAFAAPSVGPLVLTAYADHLKPGQTSDFIPIPLKAVELLPIQTSLFLTEKAQIAFFSYGGEFISQVFYQQSGTTSMQPVPITGDVAFIQVTSDVGNLSQANFRFPFQLAM